MSAMFTEDCKAPPLPDQKLADLTGKVQVKKCFGCQSLYHTEAHFCPGCGSNAHRTRWIDAGEAPLMGVEEETADDWTDQGEQADDGS